MDLYQTSIKQKIKKGLDEFSDYKDPESHLTYFNNSNRMDRIHLDVSNFSVDSNGDNDLSINDAYDRNN